MTDPLAFFPQLSNDPDLLGQLSKDMVYAGKPSYAYRADDWKTTRDILKFCHAEKLPVTFCGSQTSMTGSSVADEGVALALGKKNKILDLIPDKKTGEALVIAEPGILLGDLKRAVLKEGYFYPPDPTSYDEAQVGATIATNATGEDTFKYGPTRRYVQELELIRADGSLKTVTRQKPVPFDIVKNTAGYFLDGEEIDEVIGSEGTLALISKVTLKLLPNRGRKIVLMILPFSSFEKAIRAVQAFDRMPFKPRALELIGPGAAEYFRMHPDCPEELKSESCFLYLKDEYAENRPLQVLLENWEHALRSVYAEVGDLDCLERAFVASSDKQLEAIRQCRHYIPLRVNEEYFPYRAQGGGKVGTDWWVPVHHLHEMMLPTFEKARSLGIPFLVFAHIGNGHPHWNFLTRNPEEFAAAKDFVLDQCRQAVRLGGGVAGEHGIGKIKRDLLRIQHAPKTLKLLEAVKRKWDPDWLLGRGNIFSHNPAG